MHECVICGLYCDCDGDDLDQPAPMLCSCDHEGSGLDEDGCMIEPIPALDSMYRSQLYERIAELEAQAQQLREALRSIAINTLEAHNQQLRDALERYRRQHDGTQQDSCHCTACDKARAALAATELK